MASGDTHGYDAYHLAIKRLAECKKGEAKQRDEAAKPATLLADGAACKPSFDTVVTCISEATKAELELARLGAKDKHGNEVTGLKKSSRIVEKAQLIAGEGRGKSGRVCDVVRVRGAAL